MQLRFDLNQLCENQARTPIPPDILRVGYCLFHTAGKHIQFPHSHYTIKSQSSVCLKHINAVCIRQMMNMKVADKVPMGG